MAIGPGPWHLSCQDRLACKNDQEIEFWIPNADVNGACSKRRADVRLSDACILEAQHSWMSYNEVTERNEDYDKVGQRVIWLIDCTEYPASLHPVEIDGAWVLVFQRRWHVDAMRACDSVYADFGDLVFRIPMDCVRKYSVRVTEAWTWQTFPEHVREAPALRAVPVPAQSVLTVAQDPHGSGKTYHSTRMMVRTEEAPYRRYGQYLNFIVVTKPHSAKEVIYAEFRKQLEESSCRVQYAREEGKKYVTRFSRADGSEALCIFATVDAFLYNAGRNSSACMDRFVGLAKSIHEHGPQRMRANGVMRLAGERPRFNCRTLVVVDEASMLSEEYGHAISTIMLFCNADAHLAGDVQQSTASKRNLLHRVLTEHAAGVNTFFPGSEIVVRLGETVRRFNQHLVDFRNAVMASFHRIPGRPIRLPVASTAVEHAHGEYSVHLLELLSRSDGEESEPMKSNIRLIMDRVKGDVWQHGLLPADVLVVSPFVNNTLMLDALQSTLHTFWVDTLADAAYVQVVADRPEYAALVAHLGALCDRQLAWHSVLHRSEDGRPIDTRESRFATRIVSIHASQGDGRRAVYLVGLSEWRLKRFSCGELDIVYESLLNVAISRMKEIIRVFLEPVYDDIWQRFQAFMDVDVRARARPRLQGKSEFRLERADMLSAPDALSTEVERRIQDARCIAACTEVIPQLVDYRHPVVRMAVMNTVIWMNVAVHESLAKRWRAQAHTILRKVATLPVTCMQYTEYYAELTREERTCIPILVYTKDTACLFEQTRARIQDMLHVVQRHVRLWVGKGVATNVRTQFSPAHMVALHYAVEVVKLGRHATVKMDSLYDVARRYGQAVDGATSDETTAHHDHVDRVQHLLQQTQSHLGRDREWKIYRTVRLGQRSGAALHAFDLRAHVDHLVVTPTTATVLVLLPAIDEADIGRVSALATLYALVCMHPKHEAAHSTGTSTFQLLADRQIRVCLLALQEPAPIFVDLTDTIRENLQGITRWMREYVDSETRVDFPLAVQFADYFADFADARVGAQHIAALQHSRVPHYMAEAFCEANDIEELHALMQTNLASELRHFAASILG